MLLNKCVCDFVVTCCSLIEIKFHAFVRLKAIINQMELSVRELYKRVMK